MSAEKIVEKILLDAKTQVKKIEDETEDFCVNLQKGCNKNLEKEKKEVVKKANLQGKTIKDSYKTLANLDCKKIKQKAMQEVVSLTQSRAVDLLYNMEKADAIDFVTNLVFFAEVGDTMKVNFKNLTLTDVKKIKGIKDKKIVVEKGDIKGVIFEGKICDKNFSLNEIVSQKYGEQEKKYNDILFG